MKKFIDIREFTYIGNRVTVDGESFTISTSLPLKSSQTNTDLHAVHFHRGRPMLEETAIGNISVETVVYQPALTAWNVAKDLQENPQYTTEELFTKKVSDWKASRALYVKNIEINHNGVIYQGDETSRGRMSVARCTMLDDTETQEWTAKDNSIHSLNKEDLRLIIKAGNAQQTAIWNTNRPV